jgi:hypothetical protein
MYFLTLILPARAMMLLNMVLQTKYEAMQEIVPSVPEEKKKFSHRSGSNQTIFHL